ncbi:MAG: 4Fe-4S binding protein [Gammaproteobacteria bacterium]
MTDGGLAELLFVRDPHFRPDSCTDVSACPPQPAAAAARLRCGSSRRGGGGDPPDGVADGAVARLGELLRRRRGVVTAVQVIVAAFYVGLITVPAFLPLPAMDARMGSSLTLVAQFLFWGLWWPFVIVSVLLAGRLWCGLLCPEGALSEFASRHGLGLGIPRWLRWPGWPLTAFLATTVYGQLVSVYDYPKPALLVLGGSTLAAMAVGFLYGRGKRVWCRHLCPVNGVFGLLARVAPLHFRVDRRRWESSIDPRGAVDCAPLVDIRRMTGAAQCHMCGRCSGQRGAVTLALRAPGREVLELPQESVNPWEARLLVFGVIGTAIGAFQWSASPWFVAAKQLAAEWAVTRRLWWLLDSGAPWWALTHYPQTADTFTWLDGLLILAYIGAAALIIGGWVWSWLHVAAACLPGRRSINAARLAYALIPIGGIGVFLGLSVLTVTMLAAEGVRLPGLEWGRGLLLSAGAAWSAVLGWRLLRFRETPRVRIWAAYGALLAALSGVLVSWSLLFFIW